MAQSCRIEATRGRSRFTVRVEVDSPYLAALRAAGWTLTPAVEASEPGRQAPGRDRIEAEVDADGW